MRHRIPINTGPRTLRPWPLLLTAGFLLLVSVIFIFARSALVGGQRRTPYGPSLVDNPSQSISSEGLDAAADVSVPNSLGEAERRLPPPSAEALSLPDWLPLADRNRILAAGETYLDYKLSQEAAEEHHTYLETSPARALDYWIAFYKTEDKFFTNLILPKAEASELTSDARTQGLAVVTGFLADFRHRHSALRSLHGLDQPPASESYSCFQERWKASLQRWRTLDAYLSAAIQYPEAQLSSILGRPHGKSYLSLPSILDSSPIQGNAK